MFKRRNRKVKEPVIETSEKKEEGTPQSCPDFNTCESRITKGFYDRICNSKQFKQCHFFAMRHGDIKTPVDWLVSMAIQESHVSVVDNEQGLML